MDHKEAMERASTPGVLVWHYANLDTLAKILESNCLLATDVAFQNDIRETVTADAAFAAAIDELETDGQFAGFAREVRELVRLVDDGVPRGGFFNHEGELLDRARFIICASEDPDSLYAWRTYASGGIGCAIGLDPSVPLGVVHPNDTPGFHRVHPWRKVIYSAGETQEEAVRLLRALGEEWRGIATRTDDDDMARFDFQVVLFRSMDVRSEIYSMAKDASFVDEREQRLTVPAVRDLRSVITTPSSMGPRPHIRLASTDVWHRPIADPRVAPRLPIRAVRLGPNAPEIATNSVKWLLLANGYQIDANPIDPPESNQYSWAESVVLARSVHPYRQG